MCKTVADCALMLQVFAGTDPRDPFTRPVPIRVARVLEEVLADVHGRKPKL